RFWCATHGPPRASRVNAICRLNHHLHNGILGTRARCLQSHWPNEDGLLLIAGLGPIRAQVVALTCLMNEIELTSVVFGAQAAWMDTSAAWPRTRPCSITRSGGCCLASVHCVGIYQLASGSC